MPQENRNEAPKKWYNFHFSGKVIMCSVLFGLGLVLVGSLVMAIGIDQKSDSTSNNLDEIQYRAPMVIVGPVLMGIGGITVITGIIMCLFEMNVCLKKNPDTKPLIEEQVSDTAAKRSLPTSSSSQKREKHRNHKKASSRKHKTISKNSQGKISVESSSSYSPTSKPIDVRNSKGFTNSDIFFTPSSSFVPISDEAENQGSRSLVNSGKSWNTSTEFQTPSSSLQSSESFEVKNIVIEEDFNSEKLDNNKFEVLQHDFLTPKNSTSDSTNTEKKDQININGLEMAQNKEDLNSIDKESRNYLNHVFENLYTDDSEMVRQKNIESNFEQNHIRNCNINTGKEKKDQEHEKCIKNSTENLNHINE